MQIVIDINESDYKTLMINGGNCSVSMAERIIDSVYQGKKLPNSMWIPVSERLPKAGEYVRDVTKYYLVQNEYGDMLVARYTHGEYWEQIYQMKPIADEVVAWMPLPEPYKPESESKCKDPCLTCDCWDSDREGCTMPHSDKWYACPIENAKPENQRALEEMAAEYAEKRYYEHLEEVAGRKEDTL